MLSAIVLAALAGLSKVVHHESGLNLTCRQEQGFTVVALCAVYDVASSAQGPLPSVLWMHLRTVTPTLARICLLTIFAVVFLGLRGAAMTWLTVMLMNNDDVR
jgi:hypothetical protein